MRGSGAGRQYIRRRPVDDGRGARRREREDFSLERRHHGKSGGAGEQLDKEAEELYAGEQASEEGERQLGTPAGARVLEEARLAVQPIGRQASGSNFI